MRTAQREPWRANGTLLEPGPLISQAKKKWPQALRSGELPRRQGQANGLPRAGGGQAGRRALQKAGQCGKQATAAPSQ